MTSPAANAPSTKSKSSSSASSTSRASVATEPGGRRAGRSCSPSPRSIVRMRGGRRWTASPAAPATTRPKPKSRTMLAVVACAPVRKSEMTTIGQNSPATADAEGVLAERGAEHPGVGEDRHERSERRRRQGDRDQPPRCAPTPAASSAKPAAAPSAIEMPQPSVPRASSRRGTPLWITSMPARKKRKTSPKPERNSRY